MAWSVHTWKILWIFQSQFFIWRGLCRNTPQLIYINVVHNYEKDFYNNNILFVLQFKFRIKFC